MEKATNLAKRILTAIKGGDDAKVARFSRQVEKQINAQKALRIKSIEELEEKIADVKEHLSEVSNSVDAGSIKEIANTQQEAISYISKLNKIIAELEELEYQKEDEQKAIARLDRIEEVAFAK